MIGCCQEWTQALVSRVDPGTLEGGLSYLGIEHNSIQGAHRECRGKVPPLGV